MTDPDAATRVLLARHRTFATTLLVLMGVLAPGNLALAPGWWAESAGQ